jgi:two-component system, cell cycle sensor histidine kinase and response regulator CckA
MSWQPLQPAKSVQKRAAVDGAPVKAYDRFLMLVSSGPSGASAEPTEAVASSPSLRPGPTARTAPQQRELRGVAIRCGILGVLVLVYQGAFNALYAGIGERAFLPGLALCLLAAAWLGVRGALVVIVSVALIDRSHALALPERPETGLVAGIIALLVKLVLAGGLGLVVDSRRRARALNTQLRHEVEARERSEESLRHSESMQRALVESLGEGVGLFNAQDRVAFANQALAETLGVARDELSTKTFSEFLTDESRGTLAATTPNVRERRSYEVVLARNASTLLLVTETRFFPNGSHAELTLRVVRDLTDRVVTERRQRDLERELQRSQALQSLAVLAGGVAHDFNNLLCGVVGNAEVALRKLPKDGAPVLSRCLTEVLTFAGEAAQLSKQMLAYAGRRSLAIQALDINAELSAALRLLHATVESKAHLVLELGEELPAVGADRLQLRQVATNLILNGLDAMAGKRGTLTLRTASVRLQGAREPYGVGAGDYVKVTVSDTGAGIPPEARERLFEPFFSTKGAGRGMGLAAAAGIVRAHRGWLGVDETSTQGTSFSVLLPIAKESMQRRFSGPVALDAAPTPARSILLIDDEPAVRLVTGRMLSELGHQVVTADSGRRGLEVLEAAPNAVDLVVLDLTMPEQSGEQTLEQLRGVRSNIPVVITSGFQAEDASMLLQMPNVVGFLDKPHTMISLEMLLASVARHTPPVKLPAADRGLARARLGL